VNITGEDVTITVDGDLVATGASVDPLNSSLFNFTTSAAGGVSTISVGGSADVAGAVFDIYETNSLPVDTVLNLVSTVGGVSNLDSASIGPNADDCWVLQLGGGSNEILQARKTPERIPGDANRDGEVDRLDAGALAEHWGQNGGWKDGDFNDDGVVNAADAAILAANWGATNEQGSGPVGVPEPGLFVTLLAGALLLLVRRGR
jgi:hypothetical protein